MEICKGCVYEEYRKMPQTPIKQARVLILGEAPGSTELARGAPFVGLSGELLQRALELSGMPVAGECYITNALLCRPPKGAIRREAVERCRQRVQREIELVKPSLIMALGNTAVYSVSGNYSTKITKLHGRPFPYSPSPSILVMPCIHPAKLLRTPGDTASFRSVLEYAAELLKGGSVRDPGVTCFEVISDNQKEVNGAVAFLLEKERLVGIDIETGYTSDPLRGTILVFGVCYQKNKALVFPSYVFQYDSIKSLFESNRLKLGWQNGPYDTAFLRHRGYPARIDHDSMLLHYCLNENEGGHDLETLSIRNLGAEEYKKAVKSYRKPGETGFESVPTKILYPYVAKDSDYTYQLINKFLPMVEGDPLLKRLYYETLLPASRFLRRVRRTGFYVNVAHAEVFSRKLDGLINEATDRVLDILQPLWDPVLYKQETGHKTAPEILNPGSPEQLKWMLLKRLKLAAVGLHVDKTVLEGLRYRHASIEPILEFRSLRKVKSTYVDGVLKRMDPENLRVRSTFSLHRTVTGRLSSRNPNLQNIKDDSEVKTMFGASRGKVLVATDYSGCELRVLAYLSGDKALRDVFLAGRDLHDEVVKLLRTTRLRAKAVNFGIAYGRTAYSIAEEYKISVAEAQWLIDEWFRRFPGVGMYMKQCDRDVEAHKIFTTPFGRKRRFELLTDVNIKHVKNEARNFRVQSIASDLTLKSGMALEWDLRKLDAQIVNMVHDNIITEVPDDKDHIKYVAELIKNVMTNTPRRDPIKTDVPFGVEIKVGRIWGDMKLLEGEEDKY